MTAKQAKETEITSRLQNQVFDLEAAVTSAKREAVHLFRELDSRMRKAKNLVSDLDSDDTALWARKVSRLMDILGNCHETMEGMVAIGLVREPAGFTWDLEKVFDGQDGPVSERS
jgi:hypothetical protein